jgi:hypothetical protein
VSSGAGPGYGTVDQDYALRLATTPPDEDGPVWMVNLMKYREVAAYADDDGRPAVSGREADERYAPLDVLAAIGAEVVFVADVDVQLLGDGTVWDRVGIVRYPTRRSFVAMQSRDDFRARHVHKEAGMDRTIVLGCQLGEPPAVPADLVEPDWADVAHPPTDDDPPVIVLHVIRWADASSRELMRGYEQEAIAIAAPHGVRLGAWFDIEGTIVGDGRTWDQARFNRFPSKAAFMAVATDPRRLEAQASNREPAMADTYTMILRPTLDHL